MNGLENALADYLALRQGLGHKLAEHARLLPRFVAWMEDTGRTTITIQAALEWSQLPALAPDSNAWPRRMTLVRGFARYLSGIDPATEIPPLGLLPGKQRWKPPYIFTDTDIALVLAEAGRMRYPRDARTYTTLFGLLAVTGLRVGEALRLDVDDVDLETGVLTVTESKFGKSRLVPVLPATAEVLAGYAALRSSYRPRPGNDSFFVSRTGRRLIYASVFSVFDHVRADHDRGRRAGE